MAADMSPPADMSAGLTHAARTRCALRNGAHPAPALVSMGNRSSLVAARAAPSMLALIVILSAQLMVVLDFSIVNVALPSRARELGLAAGTIEWVVTAYAITFGGLLILGGRAGDIVGRRRP